MQQTNRLYFVIGGLLIVVIGLAVYVVRKRPSRKGLSCA